MNNKTWFIAGLPNIYSCIKGPSLLPACRLYTSTQDSLNELFVVLQKEPYTLKSSIIFG